MPVASRKDLAAALNAFVPFLMRVSGILPCVPLRNLSGRRIGNQDNVDEIRERLTVAFPSPHLSS